MRRFLFLALLLLPFWVGAQENVSVRGRIVDQSGEPVEYVQIGIPKYNVGTISSVDGRFEISVPCDTLVFVHVSYQTALYAVTGPVEDLVVVLQEQELPPAVAIGGDTKEKYLLRAGTKVPDFGSITINPDTFIGSELGSVCTARKPFLIRDIHFSLKENTVPGCVAAINIYRVEGKPEQFTNILHKPIYFDIPESNATLDIFIQPEDIVLLEPGRYFIAFQIVSCDDEALQAYRAKPQTERRPGEMSIETNIYLKGSYHREVALGEILKLPINIGISVKGLEYQ